MGYKYKDIKSKDMTVEEVINLLLYNPYKEDFWVMVDEEQRLHIKNNNWCVILDHKTGEFSFKGELHKYYEIDIISSIRDCFGYLYSFFNVMYDSLIPGEWIVVPYKDIDKKIIEDARKETEEERRVYHRKWQVQYYYRKKEELENKYREKFSSLS